MAPVRGEVGERTELPTPFRLAEARRRGQVARSGDVVAVAVMLAGLAGLAAAGPGLLRALTAMVATFLSSAGDGGAVAAAPAHGLAEAVGALVSVAWPIVVAPAVVAVLANVVQFGLLASVEPIRPDLRRLLPSAGLRRVLSTRSAVRAALGLAKVIAVVAVFAVTLRSKMEGIVEAALGGPGPLAAGLGRMACQLAVRLAVALGLLAAVDWLYQRWQHTQDLKITRRELLEDMRRMEGDVKLTGRRRRFARRIAGRRLAGRTPPGSVVIAAPRGPVVVVQARAAAGVFRVVAQAGGSLAKSVRRQAQSRHLPVVTDAGLAERLIRRCRAGDRLPRKLRDEVDRATARCLGHDQEPDKRRS